MFEKIFIRAPHFCKENMIKVNEIHNVGIFFDVSHAQQCVHVLFICEYKYVSIKRVCNFNQINISHITHNN